MTDKSLITLFSGGELAGVGARQAGFEHIGGVEKDPAIAEVAHANGFNVTVADILDVNPKKFDRSSFLHASPVCTNASVANKNRGETALDQAMADKVVEFLNVLQPKYFTLENVVQYRAFKAFQSICRELERQGYFFDVQNLNAANFGVPQTRNRMILRAVKGGLVPYLPEPVPWVGWYAAIEDLIPDLPESKFAKWQIERLEAALEKGEIFQDAVLMAQGGWRGNIVTKDAEEPSGAITANRNQLSMRALLFSGGNSNARTFRGRDADEPSHTITANEPKTPARAFLMSGGNMRSPIVESEDPSYTLTLSAANHPNRALLVAGASAFKGKLDIVKADDPSFVVKASIYKQPVRAWIKMGRVVKMTPRALARFQSVPDSYILPENATLAGKVIGNGVPCLLFRRVIESLVTD